VIKEKPIERSIMMKTQYQLPTVWFGPKAPKGHEGNWVQTMPGKGYNMLLRLYGPGQAWFDKTWKPGNFELVK
jgi:hypothetical protein